jgi:hypothetical protein
MTGIIKHALDKDYSVDQAAFPLLVAQLQRHLHRRCVLVTCFLKGHTQVGFLAFRQKNENNRCDPSWYLPGWSFNTDDNYPIFSSANSDWHLVFRRQSCVGGFGL